MAARKPRKHKILRVTGGKVAYTNTSRIPDATVESALRLLSRHTDLDKVIVHVKRDGNRRTLGRAYNGIPSIASTEGLYRFAWRYLIVVTDTAFAETLAHEARHVQRYRDGTDARARREHGRRNGMEADCNAFGSWFHDRWQEHKAAAKITP